MSRTLVLVAASILGLNDLVVGDEAVPADKAVIVVKLPAEATLSIDGEKLKAAGAERRFSASSLQAGKVYSYVLVATWTEDGKERKEQKKVTFKAGQTVPVTFAARAPGFTSREGRFTAMIPGKVAPSTEDLGRGLMRYIFSAPTAGRNYQVSYIDFPEKAIKDKDPLELLKAFRAGYREGKKFEGEKEITLGKGKVPGIEYRLDAGDGAHVRERLYLDGNRLYTIFVVGVKEKDFITSKEADGFFESFKITK
jgi:uncharacterized protein (TIGR03000 family)